jgi:porin
MSDLPMKAPLTAVLFTLHLGAAAEASERETDAPAYDFEAVYTADLWRNTRGGLRTGGVYLDNLDVTLAVDGERAWGAPGVSAFVHGLYNNSARFSERYVGDAMGLSNIDAPEAVRLYEAWMQWKSAATHEFSLRFGLYDLNSEFDTSDSRSFFVHSTHGAGHDLAQTGENGPSIFPVTSLTLRAAFSPADRWNVLAAVLDGVPGDPEHPSSNRIRVNSNEGALGIVEVQWSGERVTKISLGHWRYTAEFADLRSTDLAPLPPRDDNRGAYASIEIALDADASNANDTLAFARYGAANDRINEFGNFLGLGVRSRGLFATRPDDEFDLAVSHATVGEPARRASTGAGRERHETSIELTYRATLTEWLTMQPDIQYILHPGADPALDDSLAIGLRLEFSATMQR